MFRKFYQAALTIGAPLALAVLEIFHPHPHDLFHLNLSRWMLVHYLQIPLFPLSAYAVVVLIGDASGFAAMLTRLLMFVFGVTFVAFDTAAGLVTGILLQQAQASSAAEWQPAVMTVWLHPIVGGAGPAPLLAVIGTMAWMIGCLFAAWIVGRRRGSWLAAAFFVISAFGLFVFKTHAWPGGPITFGALAVAALILQLRVTSNNT